MAAKRAGLAFQADKNDYRGSIGRASEGITGKKAVDSEAMTSEES